MSRRKRSRPPPPHWPRPTARTLLLWCRRASMCSCRRADARAPSASPDDGSIVAPPRGAVATSAATLRPVCTPFYETTSLSAGCFLSTMTGTLRRGSVSRAPSFGASFWLSRTSLSSNNTVMRRASYKRIHCRRWSQPFAWPTARKPTQRSGPRSVVKSTSDFACFEPHGGPCSCLMKQNSCVKNRSTPLDRLSEAIPCEVLASL